MVSIATSPVVSERTDYGWLRWQWRVLEGTMDGADCSYRSERRILQSKRTVAIPISKAASVEDVFICFAALHISACGTNRTNRAGQAMSGDTGTSLPLAGTTRLTQLRHYTSPTVARHALIRWAQMADLRGNILTGDRVGTAAGGAGGGCRRSGAISISQSRLRIDRSAIATAQISETTARFQKNYELRIKNRQSNKSTDEIISVLSVLLSFNPLVNSIPTFNPVRQTRRQLNHALPFSVRSKAKWFGKASSLWRTTHVPNTERSTIAHFIGGIPLSKRIHTAP